MQELSLALNEEKIKLDGAEYTVREITEAGSIAYRAAMTRGSTMEDKKASMGEGMAESEAIHVSYCLYDPAGAPVSIDRVKAMPRRVVKVLFDIAERLSKPITQADAKN